MTTTRGSPQQNTPGMLPKGSTAISGTASTLERHVRPVL